LLKEPRYSAKLVVLFFPMNVAADFTVAAEVPNKSVEEPLYFVVLVLPIAVRSTPGPLFDAFSNTDSDTNAAVAVTPGIHEGYPITFKEPSFPVAANVGIFFAFKELIALAVTLSVEHLAKLPDDIEA
jgi:hypothetical protein